MRNLSFYSSCTLALWLVLLNMLVLIKGGRHNGGVLEPYGEDNVKYFYPQQLQPSDPVNEHHNIHFVPNKAQQEAMQRAQLEEKRRTTLAEQKRKRFPNYNYHYINQMNAESTNADKKSEFNSYITKTLDKFYSFLQRNPRFCRTLADLYTNFDRNGDGKLDDNELSLLEMAGDLSTGQANTIRSWDVDSSGDISSHEFTMGPLFISILETNPEKKHEYETKTMTGEDVTEMTNVFRAVAQSDPMRFQQEKFDVMGALKKGASAVAGAVGAVASVVGGALGLSSPKPSGPPDPSDLRPKSKFGIPSTSDEGCVLCQYLVQRIQGELYKQLVTPEDGLPTDMNAGVALKDIRRINERVTQKKGGKGLLRIVAEDCIADLCDSEDMPELFYPYCDSLQDKFGTMIDAIYYQFNFEAVCQENDMCGPMSYFSNPTSVHLPLQSKKYNAGRGQCGLMGGAHERPTGSFSTALCFASKMITG